MMIRTPRERQARSNDGSGRGPRWVQQQTPNFGIILGRRIWN